jgi:hypothetical protein
MGLLQDKAHRDSETVYAAWKQSLSSAITVNAQGEPPSSVQNHSHTKKKERISSMSPSL